MEPREGVCRSEARQRRSVFELSSPRLTLMPHSPMHLDLFGLSPLLRPPDLLAQLLSQSCSEGRARASRKEQDSLMDAEVSVARETAVRTIEEDGGDSAVTEKVSGGSRGFVQSETHFRAARE
jgi:hypothetical protein